jgi:glycerophosphoryl diester phosphodiesterase
VSRYRDLPRPLAVAHRGGAGLSPENTLEAFDRARALGVPVLETDVRVTADGVLVAFHDEHLDRLTDLTGPVAATPWAVLRRAHVRVDGYPGTHRVHRFEEVLDATGGTALAVDVKVPEAVRPLAAALRSHGAAHRVCVAGAWDGWLSAVREQTGPDLTSALGWRAVGALVACARAGLPVPRGLAGKASFVHLPWRLGRHDLLGDPVLRRRVVERAADLGLGVVAWTVDDPVRMAELLDDGVAGVITDRPDVLGEVLVRRGAWGPADRSAQGGDLEVP